jgi:hypothetical protein
MQYDYEFKTSQNLNYLCQRKQSLLANKLLLYIIIIQLVLFILIQISIKQN